LEDRLEMRKTWIWGQHTQRFGMILDFGHGAMGLPPGFEFAQRIKADVVYYPSAVPLRVLVHKIKTSEPPNPYIAGMIDSGKNDWEAVQLHYAHCVSQCPWFLSTPIMVRHVRLRTNVNEDQFYFEDVQRISVHTKLSAETYYMLLSFCLGNRFDTIGEWNGKWFSPYAVSYLGTLITW
jgi:hypothetical protein